MSVTEISLAQRVFAALVTAGADPTKIKLPHLLALVPDALELLGKRIAVSDDYQSLQTDFSATPASGLLDLTALAGILFDISRSRLRISATGVTLRPVDTYETLEDSDLPADQVWYGQDGASLRFRSTTPSLVDYAAALKIKANYIPSLTDATLPLPFEYESALVRTMIELAAMGEVSREAIELVASGRA